MSARLSSKGADKLPGTTGKVMFFLLRIAFWRVIMHSAADRHQIDVAGSADRRLGGRYAGGRRGFRCARVLRTAA